MRTRGWRADLASVRYRHLCCSRTASRSGRKSAPAPSPNCSAGSTRQSSSIGPNRRGGKFLDVGGLRLRRAREGATICDEPGARNETGQQSPAVEGIATSSRPRPRDCPEGRREGMAPDGAGLSLDLPPELTPL